MNFGPRNMQRSSEAMPAMRISPSIRWSGPRPACVWGSWARPSVREHPLEARRARPLDQHAVARVAELLEQRASLLGRRHRVLLALEAGGDRQGRLAHRDQHVDAQLVRQGADLAVVALAVGAE